MRNKAQLNWDDLRYVLAVADAGSVAGAARALGVNHATVLRRISSFETRCGLRIFEKTHHGYQLAPEQRAFVEALREAGAAFGQVERIIEAERPSVTSSIRITSTDSIFYVVLPSLVAKLSSEISSPISILSGNTPLDFARLQADITVRPAHVLPDDLAGEIAVHFRFGVYEAEGGNDAWIGMDGVISRTDAGAWLNERANSFDIMLSGDSFVMIAGLAATGHGRAVLPAFLGDTWPGLRRLELLKKIPPTPIWVASHVDLLRSGRLKSARRLLSDGLAEMEPEMMGEGA